MATTRKDGTQRTTNGWPKIKVTRLDPVMASERVRYAFGHRDDLGGEQAGDTDLTWPTTHRAVHLLIRLHPAYRVAIECGMLESDERQEAMTIAEALASGVAVVD